MPLMSQVFDTTYSGGSSQRDQTLSCIICIQFFQWGWFQVNKMPSQSHAFDASYVSGSSWHARHAHVTHVSDYPYCHMFHMSNSSSISSSCCISLCSHLFRASNTTSMVQASMPKCIYIYHAPNNYYMGGLSQLVMITLTGRMHPIPPM